MNSIKGGFNKLKYTKKLSPKDINNNSYHFIGAILIAINKFRHMLLGYKTPRTFSASQVKQTVDYEFKIVDRWLDYLRNYTGNKNPLNNKVVLELGVGPDLGTGLILLAMGAKKYYALDVHNLASLPQHELYESLLDRMRKSGYDNVDYAKEQLDKFFRGEDSGLCYVIDKDFAISKIPEKVDVVISQVAFEHFDDIKATIREISNKLNIGGLLYSHVDMKTHTRWIKNKDPLNIYRYSDCFWDMFKFRGSPNRIRIPQYLKALEENNWSNIIIEPRTILDEEYINKVLPSLNKTFRDLNASEMRILSFILLCQLN